MPSATTIIVTAATAAAALVSVAWPLAAQVDDPRAVQPERPTVATDAGTVAPAVLEIETGLEFDRFSGSTRSVISPTEFKIGLSKQAQLNLYVPVLRQTDNAARLGDIGAGVKWRFADHAPILGRLALLPAVKLPTGSRAAAAGTGTTDVAILAIASQTLGSVAVDLNFGYTRRIGDDSLAARDATSWTASFDGPAIANFGWVVEIFGYPATHGVAGQSSSAGLLFGPTLLARTWWSFDSGLIVPLRGPQPHAVYVGTVFNVGQLWARTP